MKQKLRLVFLPFLLTLSGLILVYTLLHWLILIRFELFSIKEITSNLVVPMIVSGLVVLLMVRPRLRFLKLKKSKTRNWKDFYLIIAWIVLTTPLVIAQEYLVTATGKLTVLRKASEIDHTPLTKYYRFKSFYASKRIIGIHPNFEVSGKSNQSFDMYIYVALPIFDGPADTAGTTPPAWLGFSYRKTISNRLEPAQKEESYKQFARESELDFASKNVNRFIYFDRPGSSDDREGFLEAIKSNPVYQPSKTVLVGVNEPFEARNGHKLLWFLSSTFIGCLVWLVMVLIPKLAAHEIVKIQNGQQVSTIKSELKPFWEMMRPKVGFLVTPVLIYINTAIYALMAIIGLGFIFF
ncbi:MAG: rhomboid family intramembrane serine protease, partial [Sphingobacteriaceae bacterium]